MTEADPHFNAKMKMYNAVQNVIPKPSKVEMEHIYPNPNNKSGDPLYDWKFDVYLEIDFLNYLRGGNPRKIAIEVDGKIGHTSKTSFHNREFKTAYLKQKGIELFAWPRKWIHGRKAYPIEVFLEEMHLIQQPEKTEYGSPKI
jgi:hypothetical protein